MTGKPETFKTISRSNRLFVLIALMLLASGLAAAEPMAISAGSFYGVASGSMVLNLTANRPGTDSAAFLERQSDDKVILYLGDVASTESPNYGLQLVTPESTSLVLFGTALLDLFALVRCKLGR